MTHDQKLVEKVAAAISERLSFYGISQTGTIERDITAAALTASGIDSLLTRVAELEGVLKPFVEMKFSGTVWVGRPDSDAVLYHYPTGRQITLGDFHRARKALAQEGSGL